MLRYVKLYADRPVRALRQILTDASVVLWTYLWIRAAIWLHDLVLKLGVPGQKLSDAGTGLSGSLADAGRAAKRVPLVGDDLAAPFGKAAEAARSLADAGRDQEHLVSQLALVLAALLLVGPLSLVLLGWLPLRIRWIRRASAASVLRGQSQGQDLLALRALANRPLRKLRATGPDPVDGWRRGDPAVIGALAALELRGLGLRAPRGG